MVDIGDRQTISRVRNVILALCYYKMLIYDTSIQYALEESNKYTVSNNNLSLKSILFYLYANNITICIVLVISFNFCLNKYKKILYYLLCTID